MNFLFLDISDMLFYLGHHRNVSGIQRTQSNLVRSVCRAEQEFEHVHFVSLDKSRLWYRLLDKSLLSELTSSIPDLEISHSAVQNLIESLLSSSTEAHFRPDDIYVVTGAFWIYDNVYSLYNKLKSLNVTIGCYVYDLIPINQPDFCTKELTIAFTSAFQRASHFFDFMMTISDHTRTEVDRYILSKGLPKTATATVRLAHTMSDHPSRSNEFDLAGMTFNDFILCVGTIEARKNHQLLYQVWKLLAETGIQPMPKLVIVGRWGWRVDDLRSQLAATNNLDGSIVVLQNVDDETLELLYRECKFTIFPSFVEGWGLPVGESLVHERFCLASYSSSIPEVGGRFVDYIDPYNARSVFETVRKYLEFPALLEKRNALIRSDFIARTWEDFCRDFIATALRSSNDVLLDRKPQVYPTLHLGLALDATNNTISSVVESPQDLIDTDLAFLDGWDVRENLGRWMNGRKSRMKFYCDFQSSDASIALRLYSVPWVRENSITITCDKTSIKQVVPKGAEFDLRLQLSLGSPGIHLIELIFELDGPYDHSVDPRDLCVGINSIVIMN